MNNISTFLAELAALMEKYEIDSINAYDEIITIWSCDPNIRHVGVAYEITPESLFKLSKDLENE